MTMSISTNKKYSWRERRKKQRKPLNLDNAIEEEMYPSEDDIILKHPVNGSNIRIKDNGTIQLYAGNVGLKIDPNNESIMLYGGDKISFLSQNFHINTNNSSGFKWNHCPFNPDMVHPEREILTAIKGGSEMIKSALEGGLYLETSPTGVPIPVSPNPATMPVFKAAMIKGSRIYTNQLPPTLQKIYGIQEGLKDIIESLNLKNYGGLLK